jgi:hypothetical protein
MTSKSDKKRKPSSVRHTRAVQLDRLKRPVADNLPDHVKDLFTELVHPLTMAQSHLFHEMGLRERTLTLPVMMAIFLMAIWRQIAGVCELSRLIRDEAAIWEMPQNVSQQAISARLNRLPSKLVLNVLNGLLPLMQERWEKRSRPMSPEVAWAQERYQQCLIVDGSTLDALIRKIGLLREEAKNPLAGKMTALLHLGSHLPHQIWFDPKAMAQDQTFWEIILKTVVKNSLLIFDLGYTNFSHFITLTQKGVTFITRAKSNLKSERIKTLATTATFRDTLVWIGSDETRQQVRLIEVFYKNKWHRYLTNELDPNRLPARHCVALYYRRWSIERAFLVVKRLLGLAYFWSGAQNAVEFQLWSVWIVYSILIDLSDEVAELLNLPFESLSVEMIYRSMYYYVKAVERGEADSLPYFLHQEAKHLGIVKRKRKGKVSIYDSWPLTTGVLA